MMNTHLRKILKKAIAVAGGSATDLAKKLGLDRGTVARWERGAQAPSGDSVYLLYEFVARAERVAQPAKKKKPKVIAESAPKVPSEPEPS